VLDVECSGEHEAIFPIVAVLSDSHPGGDCTRVMEISSSPVLTRPTNSLAVLLMLPTH
jgi:hypothetical protein